jgi:hypothetical protein
MGLSTVLTCLLLAIPLGLTHPAGTEEKVYLHNALPQYRRSLSHCQSTLEDPEFLKRTIARRLSEVNRLKKERGLEHQ